MLRPGAVLGEDGYQVVCVPNDLLGSVVMRTKLALRRFFYLLAVVLLLCAGWCLLWVVSSSSMAFTECNGAYELLSSNARCRQPSIAGLLALASLLGAVLAMFIGWRFGRRPGSVSDEPPPYARAGQ